jgi:hypothetical protein
VATFLVVVARMRPDLYAYIRRAFFSNPRFELLFDRRRVCRRRVKGSPAFDRRTRDRRTRPEADEEVRVQGWAAVASGQDDG